VATTPAEFLLNARQSTDMESRVHPQAQSGFSTSTSDFYDKVRPSYPAEALSFIRKSLGEKGDLNVVEIGSGTGIFTRALLAHPEWSPSVKALRAVEPSEGMRSTFAKMVNDERVTLTEGTFDHTGVDDQWANVIVIAQAFHWCLDHSAAMLEFSRILKADGVVACVWNTEDQENVPWIRQLYDLAAVYDESRKIHTNDYRTRDLFEVPAYVQNFADPVRETFVSPQRGTLEIATNRCMSWSPLAILPAEEKAVARGKVEEIIRRGDGMKWSDKEGVFELVYETLVILMCRK